MRSSVFGLAVPYGRVAFVSGRHVQFARRAFGSGLLSLPTAVELWLNHRPGTALASTADGSLTLVGTADGLYFDARLSEFHARAIAGQAFGPLHGISISWSLRREISWRNGDVDVVTSVTVLREISLVTGRHRPAFPGTSAGVMVEGRLAAHCC